MIADLFYAECRITRADHYKRHCNGVLVWLEALK